MVTLAMTACLRGETTRAGYHRAGSETERGADTRAGRDEPVVYWGTEKDDEHLLLLFEHGSQQFGCLAGFVLVHPGGEHGNEIL